MSSVLNPHFSTCICCLVLCHLAVSPLFSLSARAIVRLIISQLVTIVDLKKIDSCQEFATTTSVQRGAQTPLLGQPPAHLPWRTCRVLTASGIRAYHRGYPAPPDPPPVPAAVSQIENHTPPIETDRRPRTV
jgi:hypothetical protein